MYEYRLDPQRMVHRNVTHILFLTKCDYLDVRSLCSDKATIAALQSAPYYMPSKPKGTPNVRTVQKDLMFILRR